MAVVTISRQMGSWGGRVGRLAAKQLGYAVADKDTIEKVFRQYGLTKLGDLYAKPPSIWELFNYDSMLTVSMLNEVIQALAKRGNVVILGRGGFGVLDGVDGVLDVRVEAPDDVRAQRVAERSKVDPERAASRVGADDEARAKFVKLFYGKDSSDHEAFDLVLDTGELSREEAAARVVEAVGALSSDPAKRTVDSLEVDPVLAEAVNRSLG